MRVTLLQVDLSGKSRAEGFLRLSGAIDAAAGAAPGPDLVVLPGGVDLIGVSPRNVTAANLDAVREFLSLKAREWGVYLAAGLTRRDGQDVATQGVVFDPDGDIVLCYPEQRTSSTARCGAEPFWDTSVGRLGVLDPETGDMPCGEGPTEPTAVLMIWSIAGATTIRLRDRLRALRADASARGRMHWAVVVPANSVDPENAVVSFVTTSDGGTVAAAPAGGTDMVTAVVPVVPDGSE